MTHMARTLHPCLGMENRETVTLTEAARLLGVSRATVGRYLKKGILTPVRLPSGHRRVLRASLDKELAKMQGA